MKKPFSVLTCATLLASAVVTPAFASEDTFEPNNTTAEAYSVQANNTYSSYISSNTDVDYYTFTTTDNGVQNIKFMAPTDQFYSYNITDAAGNPIAGGSTKGPYTIDQNVSLSANTKYFIKVRTDQNASIENYKLMLGNFDAYEPNNTTAQAKTMTPQGVYTSYLSSIEDVDYYVLTSNQSGRAKLIFTAPADVVTNYNIVDENGITIAGGSTLVSGPLDVQFNVDANKKYYMKVYGTNGTVSSDPYKIQYLFTDPYEPNDTLGTATPVQSGHTIQGALYLHHDADVDYYSFTANATGKQTVHFTAPPDKAYSMDLTDASGNPLKGTSGYGPTALPVTIDVTSGQTYYIKVTAGSQGASNVYNYNLILDQIQVPAPSQDVLIANSPVDIQTPAGVAKVLQFKPTTTKSYRIYTGPYGGTGSSNDTVLELYTDAALTNRIAFNDDYNNTFFSSVTATLNANQTYFVKVRPYGSAYGLNCRLTAN